MKSKKNKTGLVCLILTMFLAVCALSACVNYSETVLVEKTSYDEFTSEVSDIVKEYDVEKLDEEAISNPYYSRRLIVQGTGKEDLDLKSYGAKIVVEGPDNMYVMQFTTSDAAEEACEKLQNAENVEYCEPDQYGGSLKGIKTDEEESEHDNVIQFRPSSEESAQTDPLEVYKDVLSEYKMLAKNHFDYYGLRDAIKYANEGVSNFCGTDLNGQYYQYSVYYSLVDLAGDGELELLVSINETEPPYSYGECYHLVDIFGIKDGKPVALIESDVSVGYRDDYYITTDKKIKEFGNGGHFEYCVGFYKVSPNSASLELEDMYYYEGYDGVDKYTHTDSTGSTENISSDEYDSASARGEIDYEIEWTLLDIEDSDRKTENNDKSGASKEAYQGIFMNGDIFIGLPLYTGGFDDDPVGVAYRNTKPEWGDDGLIESDVIETLGEIYDLGSGEYEIRGKGTTYDLTYYDGKVVLTGDSEYAGTYVQISNSGADMDPSEVWLDIPE